MSMKIFEWKDYGRKEYLVHSYNLDSPYSFPLHSHRNHWELVYCEEGQFHHQVNGEIYNHSEGRLMFIREADRHLLKGRDFRYSNIAFSGAWMDTFRRIAGDELVQTLIKPDRRPPYAVVPQTARRDLEGQIRALRSSGKGGRADLKFSRFLHYVFDSFFLPESGDEPLADIPQWLRDLILHVNEEENRIPSVEELVELSCRCAEHVSRSFRKYMGKSPSAYLKNLKLNRASELLLSTNYPVKEICYLCSYDNANYFHRQFRDTYGMTPLEYRRNLGRRIH
ncbi:helix-turn-helix transcriptional regulator [Spirochaeta isovalerica]|uniref:AraC family cel operon transcriptional repressor n=1 Tax=Spirochaeta isovalerica TaxID=150 RepID=A0A841R8P5_9SPIO|nr:AraC family transcriptional regulator [Spirochaeta isovalerica]MBB6479731.1 AraC family cel operon transcriptional repressor [Spirochaeta isovalerica]